MSQAMTDNGQREMDKDHPIRVGTLCLAVISSGAS